MIGLKDIKIFLVKYIVKGTISVFMMVIELLKFYFMFTCRTSQRGITKRENNSNSSLGKDTVLASGDFNHSESD